MLISFLAILGPMGAPAAQLEADKRLDGKVTFTARAAGVSRTLETFSKATGIALTASKAVQPEVLLLRLNQAPIRETMRRIANACGASWRAEGDGYRLVRTGSDEARRADVARQSLIRQLQDAFHAKLGNSQDLVPFDQATADRIIDQQRDGMVTKNGARVPGLPAAEHMRVGSPLDRFKASVIRRLDPLLLAEAPPKQRTVFSTAPTAPERRLPVGVSDLFECFGKTQCYAEPPTGYLGKIAKALDGSQPSIDGCNRRPRWPWSSTGDGQDRMSRPKSRFWTQTGARAERTTGSGSPHTWNRCPARLRDLC
jgi:hypothetical protein